MSKILITGNGFDLFHHLPTKYGHFMSIMMTIEETSFSSDDITFEELFGSFFKQKFENDYNLIIQNYDVDKIIFLKSDVEEISDFLKKNHWFRHFKTILNLSTWIDFEMEIERVLNQFAILFNESNHKNSIDYRQSKLNINENFMAFEVFYIVQNNYIKVHDYYIDLRTKCIDSQKVLEHLSKSLKQFRLLFNDYIVKIVSIFYGGKKARDNSYLKKIDKFLTFNYTDTLQEFYEIEHSNLKYIHGRINKNSEENTIVIGVENIPEQLKHCKIFDFEKSFQRIINGINSVFIEEPKEGKYGEKINFFYIIGHSLDKSDNNYINDVFRYLTLDQSKLSKIIIFYYNTDDYTLKLRNLYSYFSKEHIEKFYREERLVFVTLNEKNLVHYINDIEIEDETYI